MFIPKHHILKQLHIIAVVYNVRVNLFQIF